MCGRRIVDVRHWNNNMNLITIHESDIEEATLDWLAGLNYTVRHSYPPDKQEKATQTVLEQAEVLCKDWVTE